MGITKENSVPPAPEAKLSSGLIPICIDGAGRTHVETSALVADQPGLALWDPEGKGGMPRLVLDKAARKAGVHTKKKIPAVRSK